MEKISKEITYRKQRGLSIRKSLKDMGISRTTYYRWVNENGMEKWTDLPYENRVYAKNFNPKRCESDTDSDSDKKSSAVSVKCMKKKNPFKIKKDIQTDIQSDTESEKEYTPKIFVNRRRKLKSQTDRHSEEDSLQSPKKQQSKKEPVDEGDIRSFRKRLDKL